MKFPSLICFAALILAACETVPETIDPAVFGTQIEQAEANSSVVSADARLTELLARPDLTVEQRADALYLRANKRFEGKYNIPGAMSDFDAFAALAPEDDRNSAIERRKVFAATEIENAQRRLAWLQTLEAWFNDKVLMGEMPVAAARYKSSGLTPTDFQLYLLKEGGFVCMGEGEVVHKYGPKPSYAIDAVWCPDQSVS